MLVDASAISLLSESLAFFFQAEDGIRDLVRSRGLGDVYKRQMLYPGMVRAPSLRVFSASNSAVRSKSDTLPRPSQLSLIHI